MLLLTLTILIMPIHFFHIWTPLQDHNPCALLSLQTVSERWPGFYILLNIYPSKICNPYSNCSLEHQHHIPLHFTLFYLKSNNSLSNLFPPTDLLALNSFSFHSAESLFFHFSKIFLYSVEFWAGIFFSVF